MMVPQSYRHATTPVYSRSSIDHGRDVVRASRPRDIPKKPNRPDGRPKMLSSLSSPTPSKPVIIPTRTQTPRARKPQHANDSSKPTISPSHDPSAISPSMAALMAVASVQSPSNFTMRQGVSGINIRKDSLSLDDFRYTLSSSSPKSWSILQSPPSDGYEENREHDGDSWSIASSSTVAALSSYRSLSSDSMPSLDMEMDLESPESPGPPSPAIRVKSYSRREKRLFHRLSLAESDHPLTPPSENEMKNPTPEEKESTKCLPAEPATPVMSPQSPFRSNLTASIRLFKSAARTLSNYAPKHYSLEPIPRQTPSFVKQSSSTEALPPPVSFPPTLPNIDALPSHLNFLCPMPNLPPSASIQLMPYVPSPISGSALATAPPIFLPAANSVDEAVERKMALPRPREPRENGDFLRVVVLEMNMRRLGKLNGEGRARIWLGPRLDGEEKEDGDILGGVVGADEAVEKQVLEEEGEPGVEAVAGSTGGIKSTKNLSVASQTPSEAGLGKKQVPSRWVGMTP